MIYHYSNDGRSPKSAAIDQYRYINGGTMRIAFIVDGSDMAASIPDTYESGKYLIIVEAPAGSVLLCTENATDSGMGSADIILEQDCEAVVSGDFTTGPAFEKLACEGVTRYDGKGLTAKEALALMNEDKLEIIRDYIGGPGCGGEQPHDDCNCGEEHT
jgi:hypothetical protein